MKVQNLLICFLDTQDIINYKFMLREQSAEHTFESSAFNAVPSSRGEKSSGAFKNGNSQYCYFSKPGIDAVRLFD
jgi:hypothetical protein